MIDIKNISNIVNGSNHNSHPDEQSQEFNYYPFAVKLDKCVGSCNTLNEFSNKVCVTNKIEHLNLSLFNMIQGINEPKNNKHTSYEYKCIYLMEENGIQINGGIMTNVDVSCEKVCDKDYIWNPSTYICENGTNLASILDDLAITFDEYIQSCNKETKTITTNFNENKSICKKAKFRSFTCIFINYYIIIEKS